MASAFEWTEERTRTAIALAEGKTQKEVAEDVSISDRTIRNWLAEPEFAEEVDRLSLMLGMASRAERLRLTNRVIRQKVKDGVAETEKDLLDWVKFAQSETDGIKLDLSKLAALTEADASLADRGSDRPSAPAESVH